MYRLSRIYKIGLISFVCSQGFLLSGCDFVESEGIITKVALENTTSEQQEEIVAIHVDSSAQSLDPETAKAEAQTLELNNDLIAELYPRGDNQELIYFLETVSTELLEFLVSHQVELFTQSSLENYHSDYSHNYGEVQGVYLPQENKIIFKEMPGSEFESFLAENFFHEVGHAVDTHLGDLAMTERFKLIFEEGKDLIFSGTDPLDDYYRENIWEYFAESFNLFFKNPEKLARHEETYKYICSVIEQIL